MRINGVSALPQVETPGWNAPPGEELATIYTDTYKLGLLALRLLTGDHDTTNPQHLPSTTPTQLRQIITDTLTNPPHQRPLPEAWTNVLGNAIEHAQHQQKTTPPVSAAPDPPPTPIVRSRPPAHSAPPVGPSAPPVPQPRPAERAAAEIGTPPPPSEQRPRRSLKWPLVALGIILLVLGFLAWFPMNRHGILGGIRYLGLIVLIIGLVLMAMRPRRRLKWPLIAAIVVVLAASAGITGYLLWFNGSGHTVLPFTGLDDPMGVAVDAAGTVYVTDGYQNNRVLKLAAGSSTQSVLPFPGLNGLGLAVDSAGNLYGTEVTDGGKNYRVLELVAGSSTPVVLPFTGLNQPWGVAVDVADNLYVAEYSNDRVVKLAAGSSAQTVLPFTGLSYPRGVAVDTAGTVYVADMSNNRVVKLAAGSATQTVVPYSRLIGFENSINEPSGVAVDAAGNIYVADWGNHRVLKLPAG